MVPIITIPASRAGGAAAFAVAAPHDRGYHPYKEEENGRSEGSLGEGALPPCSTPLGVSFQPCLRLGSESSLGCLLFWVRCALNNEKLSK